VRGERGLIPEEKVYTRRDIVYTGGGEIVYIGGGGESLYSRTDYYAGGR
jgi:hypothetical protein